MNLSKPQQPKQPSSGEQSLHRTLNDLQTRLSDVIRIPQFSISNPFSSSSLIFDKVFKKKQALSIEEIKKRMVGIPVYMVSNYEQKRCCAASADRKIEFFFFSKADAENYLQRFGSTNDMKIFDAPLAHIMDYEGDEPPIRLVPELSQVNNAAEERKKDTARFPDETFSGVPVFQTDQLIMEVKGKREKFRPAYLRKEDLERALVSVKGPENVDKERDKRALVSVKGSENIDKERDIIEVATFEDIIRGMKDCSTSKWNDVIFVAPGITSWLWY